MKEVLIIEYYESNEEFLTNIDFPIIMCLPKAKGTAISRVKRYNKKENGIWKWKVLVT